jgi:hypothetical protein
MKGKQFHYSFYQEPNLPQEYIFYHDYRIENKEYLFFFLFREEYD